MTLHGFGTCFPMCRDCAKVLRPPITIKSRIVEAEISHDAEATHPWRVEFLHGVHQDCGLVFSALDLAMAYVARAILRVETPH